MTEERDPYAVLGVASTATPDEVATAYRTLARRHHPDVSAEARRPAADGGDQRRLERPARSREAGRVGPGERASSAADARPVRRTPGVARPTAPSAPRAPAARRARRHAAGTAPRAPSPGAAARRARAPRDRPPGTRAGRSCRSGGTSAGRWARSLEVDPGYLAWLQPRREGAPYREEIDRSWRRLRSTPAGRSRHPPQAPPVPLTAASAVLERRRGTPRSGRARRPATGLRPCPSLGYVTSRPPRSVGIAASRRSIRANGSEVPDRSSAGHVDRGPVRDARGGVLGLPGGWSG